MKSIKCIYPFFFCFLFSLIANTQNPGVPEAESFTPAGVDNMVDLFSGDFQYNITLFEVDGYPVNISYNSNVGVEDQASWVGLGWNLTPGSINRIVRGIPDDFAGDEIIKQMNMKDDVTIGAKTGLTFEIYGFDALKLAKELSIGFEYNNYNGWDYNVGSSKSFSATAKTGGASLGGSLSLSSGASKSGGTFLRPAVGFSVGLANRIALNNKLSASINSRKGLEHLTYTGSLSANFNSPIKFKVGKLSTTSGLGIGASFPLAKSHPTFTPYFDVEKTTLSGGFDIQLGVELYGFSGSGKLGGHFAYQGLQNTTTRKKAYGYYLIPENPSENALLDFNREKNGPYFEETPHLPIPHFTYDLYAVTAQGFQGQFRPFRRDVGMVYDPRVNSNNIGINGGADVAVGNLVKGGGTAIVNITDNNAGVWDGDKNAANQIFHFENNLPVYFKQVGELTAMQNETAFNNLGGFDAFRINIGNLTSKQSIQIGSGDNVLNNKTINNSNEIFKTNSAFTPNQLTPKFKGNRHSYDLFKKIYSATGLTNGGGDKYYINQADVTYSEGFEDTGHHFSEMVLTASDGRQLIYSHPVYNHTKEEVTFNCSGLPIGRDGLVTYITEDTNQASINNNLGIDHYYSSTTTPAYVEAILLSAIVSPDYKDLSNDGPTPDDLGTYTRFHYEKKYDKFGWRMPIEQHKANYNENKFANNDDQMASFVYGEKEVWQLKFIETRNYLAEFYTSSRNDGCAIWDRNGGVNCNKSNFKLDSIKLFSRPDIVKNGYEATPIRTVYFKYGDYLSYDHPGTDGGDYGKLTLEEISFANRESNRDKWNPYVFNYSNSPPYNRLHINRWGNYTDYQHTNYDKVKDLYHYVAKDKTQADNDAKAWLLDEITTPQKSKIEIAYESDDYAYVQDQKAMDLVPIIGFGATEDCAAANNTLYEGDAPKRYLFFELTPGKDQQADLYDYIKDGRGVNEIYFNCLMNEVDVGKQKQEWVKGFFPFSYESNQLGVCPNTNQGWIQMPTFDFDGEDTPNPFGGKMHPFTKATAQQLVKYNPKVAYGLDEVRLEDFVDVMKEMAIAVADLPEFLKLFDITKFYKEYHDGERARSVDLSHAYIRLNNVKGQKFGGGARVKTLKMYDNWGTMTNQPNNEFDYGKEYDYTTILNGDTISSGVASYEPIIGGDENRFHFPARYRQKKTLASDVNDFNILPLNEFEFPSPSVGYSKVKVQNLKRDKVERTGTGYQITEFYTAKDFPTITKSTRLDRETLIAPPNPLIHMNHATTSQGYAIELNNMHGQKKSEFVYPEPNPNAPPSTMETPISGIKYHFKTDGLAANHLSSSANTIDPETGIIEEKMLGVNYDVVVDSRESSIISNAGGLSVNVDVSIYGLFPVPTFTIFPELEFSQIRYKSLVSNKVITRTGILDRVEFFEDGNSLNTFNLLYDQQTGEVIVSGVENEFKDTIFSTNLPAHWFYDKMGSISGKPNYSSEAGLVFNNGKTTIPNASNYFSTGDTYHLVTPLLSNVLASITKISGNEVNWIDIKGNPIPDGIFGLNPVHLDKGNLNMLMQKHLAISTLENPIRTNELHFDNVLNARKITYDEHWQTYLAIRPDNNPEECSCSTNQLITSKGAYDVYKIILGLLTDLNGQNLEDLEGQKMQLNGLREDLLIETLGTNTIYYYIDKQGSVLTIYFQNEQATEHCAIYLKMENGQPFPEYYNIWDDAQDQNVVLEEGNTLSDCNDKYTFYFNLHGPGLEVGPTYRIKLTSDCFPFTKCSVYGGEVGIWDCGIEEGDNINPYINGIKGTWRQKSIQKYYTDRLRSGNPRFDGTYKFFHLDGAPTNGVSLSVNPALTPPQAIQGHWLETVKQDVIDPYNKTLLFTDSIGLQHANIYGYNFHLPLASAANAHYQNIFYDGFEDYDYENQAVSPYSGECVLPPHSRILPRPSEVHKGVGHTGKSSLLLGLNEKITVGRNLFSACNPKDRSTREAATYQLQLCDEINPFSPTPGKYVLSAWALQTPVFGIPLDTLLDSVAIVLKGTINNVTTTIDTFKAEGPIINYWQQIYGEFLLEEGNMPDSLTIEYVSLTNSLIHFIDDVRIHPFNASMISYVYDPIDLRIMATLDERNYATYYEYDQKGNLARIKKETEDGQLTIQEFRSSLVHEEGQ